jgi:nitroreductase
MGSAESGTRIWKSGHAAQNVYLQAASLNMGTTLVGAFDDKRVKEVLKLPSDEQPLGLMPIGGR